MKAKYGTTTKNNQGRHKSNWFHNGDLIAVISFLFLFILPKSVLFFELDIIKKIKYGKEMDSLTQKMCVLCVWFQTLIRFCAE